MREKDVQPSLPECSWSMSLNIVSKTLWLRIYYEE